MKCRILKSCGNCQHVFNKMDCDGTDECYCTFNAPERPLCGSVMLDEQHGGPLGSLRNKEAYKKDSKKWDEWIQGRGVYPNGKCDDWEEWDKENNRSTPDDCIYLSAEE